MDLDFDDHASLSKKFKQAQVVLFDEMEVERDSENSDVVIGHEKLDTCSKGKSKVGDPIDTWPNHMMACDIGITSSLAGSAESMDDDLKGSINMKNINSSNSDLSFTEDNNFCDDGDNDDDDDDDDYIDDNSDYGDNDVYMYEEEDDYLAIQSQFDNVDLPSGVEASLPWLKDPSGACSSTVPESDPSLSKGSIPDIAETKSKESIPGLNEKESPVAAVGSSSVTVESNSTGEVVDNEENSIIHKFKSFKQFDTVEDFSDHHYNCNDFSKEQRPLSWAKRIQDEWKILEKDLPDTIAVRVYETRMELLRAVIIGPAGTPYHDGLFFFDCIFPATYPNTPPMVYYYSGGLRLNPNLYHCGKVCLSLLGTWSGKKNEMWIPGTSTMLQVLVSIQALILNAKPFFNEPGHESSFKGSTGDLKSKEYNENTFILSLKTMIYTLRRPPKYFEDFVIGHFHSRARDILTAIKAYEKGVMVGSADGAANIHETEMSASLEFQTTLTKMRNSLATNFTRFASAADLEEFQATA